MVLGVIGVAVFLLTAYAGLAGTDAQRDNLAPTMVYVAFWVGVPFASLLVGDVWRLLSPWRAIGRGAGWIAQRFGGGEMPEPMAYPARLGRWPAALGLLGFGICELAWGTARDPLPLAVIMLAYTVVMLVGMSLYGVEAWSRNADAFGLYFGLFASLSRVHAQGARRRCTLRPPVVGATTARPAARAPRRCSSSASASPPSTAPRRGRCSTTPSRTSRTSSRGSASARPPRSSSASSVGLLARRRADRPDLDDRRRRHAGPARARSSCTR